MNRNPGIVLDEIQEAREEVSRLGAEYSVKRDRLSASDVAYQKELSKSYLRMLDEVKRSDGRFDKLPAEDMRKVIAHDEMNELVWAAYIMREGEVEAADKLLRAAMARLSSLQSELKWLETEYKATPVTSERTPTGPLY